MPQYTINKTYNYTEDSEDFFNRYLNINDSIKYYDILGIRNPTIYGAGLNDRNQLLNVSSTIPFSAPISLTKPVSTWPSKIDIFNNSVAFFDEQNAIWAWGKIPGSTSNYTTPTLLTPAKRTSYANSDLTFDSFKLGGKRHIAVLDNKVHTWGENSGLPANGVDPNSASANAVITVPTFVNIPTSHQLICYSVSNSAVIINYNNVSVGGTIFVWGDNTYGELGTGNTTAVTTYTQVQNGIGILKDISTVEMWTLAILANGTLAGWGGPSDGSPSYSRIVVDSNTNWVGLSGSLVINSLNEIYYICPAYGTTKIKLEENNEVVSICGQQYITNQLEYKYAVIYRNGTSYIKTISIDHTVEAASETSSIQLGTSSNWKSINIGAGTTFIGFVDADETRGSLFDGSYKNNNVDITTSLVDV